MDAGTLRVVRTSASAHRKIEVRLAAASLRRELHNPPAGTDAALDRRKAESEAEAEQDCVRCKPSRALMNDAILLMRLSGAPEHACLVGSRAFVNYQRTVRCGTCKGCLRENCGECSNCLDKPRFGGKGLRKRACVQRSCVWSSRAPKRKV